eukprot:TRINITY_DN2778_c0_g1::TRINITY_DN2778_c0_g1_i1::g.27539::m.27539 TRINITY_DN2778_c0_g1::TRINITY_DN2778_c0_g1_i1::g.27539  ORF type:complete len:414 (-),score=9.89,PB1/PF00564.19/2.6e-09,PB1/PF00564.19/1e+04,HSDR_N_2/PF13588.1/0.0067 TRINITY_DN2778_c0_g1_i1:154-1395(-)
MTNFKTFLQDDIRRFELQQVNFQNLSSKVVERYGNKLPDQFDLKWVDSDGDRVTIQSDDDLTVALSSNPETLVVYVMPSNNPSAPPQPASSPDAATITVIYDKLSELIFSLTKASKVSLSHIPDKAFNKLRMPYDVWTDPQRKSFPDGAHPLSQGRISEQEPETHELIRSNLISLIQKYFPERNPQLEVINTTENRTFELGEGFDKVGRPDLAVGPAPIAAFSPLIIVECKTQANVQTHLAQVLGEMKSFLFNEGFAPMACLTDSVDYFFFKFEHVNEGYHCLITTGCKADEAAEIFYALLSEAYKPNATDLNKATKRPFPHSPSAHSLDSEDDSPSKAQANSVDDSMTDQPTNSSMTITDQPTNSSMTISRFLIDSWLESGLARRLPPDPITKHIGPYNQRTVQLPLLYSGF